MKNNIAETFKGIRKKALHVGGVNSNFVPNELLVRIVARIYHIVEFNKKVLNIDNSLNKPLNSAIIFTNC